MADTFHSLIKHAMPHQPICQRDASGRVQAIVTPLASGGYWVWLASTGGTKVRRLQVELAAFLHDSGVDLEEGWQVQEQHRQQIA